MRDHCGSDGGQGAARELPRDAAFLCDKTNALGTIPLRFRLTRAIREISASCLSLSGLATRWFP
jgi:hypothetical protein